jgi:hypothetical protein
MEECEFKGMLKKHKGWLFTIFPKSFNFINAKIGIFGLKSILTDILNGCISKS